MAAPIEIQLYCPWCLTPEPKTQKTPKPKPGIKVEMQLDCNDHDRIVDNLRYRCPRCKYEEMHDSPPSSWVRR